MCLLLYHSHEMLIKQLLYTCVRSFCSFESNVRSKSDASKSQYSHTVLLPKSKFPMKHSRKLEWSVANSGNFDPYECDELSDKTFALHDGPPYANGPIHFGHAINKILKDIICRRKALEGYNVDYIPGWDCHGLPIELKANQLGNGNGNGNEPKTALEIRKRAKQFALNTIQLQKKSFIGLGVRGHWDAPYVTLEKDYVINQLKIFCELFEKGLIFRNNMPVHWSPSTLTALAEAELQYNHQHISKSVYVKFKLINHPKSVANISNLYALIWTTTPWTLPANQGIAYDANQSYCVIKVPNLSDDHLIVANELIPNLEKVFNSSIHIICSFNGSDLTDVKYFHPIKNEELPFIHSEYVTMTKGTGLVHSAPNHGHDDYKLSLKYNIPLDKCLVNENGCYNTSAGPLLNGKSVLTEGTECVIDMFGRDLLLKEDYVHSYPYDWRSNEPVITRASSQWFINMDLLRNDCIRVLEDVKFYPEFAKNVIVKQLEKRPHWCISRQRLWGVFIPILYNRNDNDRINPIVTREFIEHVIKLIKQHGTDLWWNLPVEQIVPKDIRNKLNIETDSVILGNDIFDIWFDSGISWSYALTGTKVADLYLEGIDQLRGWFQSSLITSVALRGCAPYKAVFVHGFAVDNEGKKMSKSLGNVTEPNDIIDGNKTLNFPSCGTDGLRLWVAMHADGHENVNVSVPTFEETIVVINKIRNTLRFIMGSLHEFNGHEHCCNTSEMYILDRYMLHLLTKYCNTVNECYKSYQLSVVTSKSIDFISNDASSFYCSRIKDRLYCESKYSLKRRSCQTVLYHLYNTIVRQLSPILPHIMTEANNYLKIDPSYGVHQWEDNAIEKTMELPLEINNTILKDSPYKHLIEYDCHIKIDDAKSCKMLTSLQTMHDYDVLCELLQTSDVIICENELPNIEGTKLKGSYESDNPLDYEILLSPAKKFQCNRCRRYTSEQRSHPCDRCLHVLALQWN